MQGYSHRIANVGKRDSDDSGDDDNDSDWSGHTERKPEHAKGNDYTKIWRASCSWDACPSGSKKEWCEEGHHSHV